MKSLFLEQLTSIKRIEKNYNLIMDWNENPSFEAIEGN